MDDWKWEGVHLVWLDANGAEVYHSGEDDITQKFIDDNKIDTIITVNTNTTYAHFDVPKRHYLRFHDDSPSKQEKGMRDNAANAVHELEECIKRGEKVIVHCHAGIHRSTAVIVVALTRLGYFPNTYEAFYHVRKFRPWARYYKTLVKWVEIAAKDVHG